MRKTTNYFSHIHHHPFATVLRGIDQTKTQRAQYIGRSAEYVFPRPALFVSVLCLGIEQDTTSQLRHIHSLIHPVYRYLCLTYRLCTLEQSYRHHRPVEVRACLLHAASVQRFARVATASPPPVETVFAALVKLEIV